MKYVTASRLTYDASEGRIEPGATYYVEDDKAERWINAGIAAEGKAPPPPPPPEPEPEPEEEESEVDDGEPSEDVAAEAHKLHDEGLSERAIAQQLGISRTKVHSLLQGA